MGLLTFGINVTLDGCVDHREGIADDETHAFFTRLMDEGGAMLWGRVTYEMMEAVPAGVRPGERGAKSAAPPAKRASARTSAWSPRYPRRGGARWPKDNNRSSSSAPARPG
jgi:hypothetical protein